MAVTRADGGTLGLARHSDKLRDGTVALGLAASIFFLTYANGGFFPTTRAYAAIAVWWLLGVAAAVGIGEAWSRVSRLAIAACGLLAAFAIWVLISISWAPDAERAFAQFDQVSLYVAVLVLAVLLARIFPASLLIGAVAFALSVVAVVALISRFFPSSFGPQAEGTLLPDLNVRLSFPLGYWNGLGVDVALALPLLLATMTARRFRVASVLAALPLPAIAAVMYLTSSRGAFLAALVGIVAFILLAPHRWTALVAAFFAGGVGAVAVKILVPRHELVTGQMNLPLAVSQGHYAALVIGLTCIASAVVWVGIAELARRLPSPRPIFGWATSAILVALGIAGVVAAHPIRRFHDFKGAGTYGGNQTYVTQHLLSSSGGGHWQFWQVAMTEFKAHPLNGGGAGSWEYWWLHLGRFPLFSQFAHSIYLETMAELGIVGLLLLGGAILVGVVGGARTALRLRSGEVAAATACGTAFFVSAAFEWTWQLAGVAVVGLGMLGIALGASASTEPRAWRPLGFARPVLALVAVAAMVPLLVLLAAGIHLRNSQSAALNGNSARARSEALAAKAVEPWAASSYLQLAKISFAEARYGEADRWVGDAISRSRRDYNLWIEKAAIDVKLGKILLAHRDLVEVCSLYPLESYFCAKGS